MNIKITSKDGLTLKTKGKYVREDINVSVDDSILGITPTGTYQVTGNGEYDITEYAKVNVNVPTGGGGGNTLKDYLDITKTAYQMFKYQYYLTNVDNVLTYDATGNVTNMAEMFYYCEKLITIPQLDTSNVTDMNNMFRGCYAIKTIPQLDTSNVTDMASMFYDCRAIKTIPQLDTSNVTNMAEMFRGCHAIKTIPQLDTSKVTNMVTMFRACYALTMIDISHFNISSTSNSNGWCYTCYSLKALIIRSFGTNYVLGNTAFTNCYHLTGTVNETYNPDGLKDGYIYVPRNMVDTLKSATNWSTYADQIRALEDYTVDGTTTGELDESKI